MYFTNIQSMEELRKEFKMLARKFHPDFTICLQLSALVLPTKGVNSIEIPVKVRLF